MTDISSNPGDQPVSVNPERIDIGSDDVVHRWAQKLDVTTSQIKDAVGQVGDLAADVEMHLKGVRSTTNDDRVEDAK